MLHTFEVTYNGNMIVEATDLNEAEAMAEEIIGEATHTSLYWEISDIKEIEAPNVTN